MFHSHKDAFPWGQSGGQRYNWGFHSAKGWVWWRRFSKGRIGRVRRDFIQIEKHSSYPFSGSPALFGVRVMNWCPYLFKVTMASHRCSQSIVVGIKSCNWPTTLPTYNFETKSYKMLHSDSSEEVVMCPRFV